jgi:hypothetical protein
MILMLNSAHWPGPAALPKARRGGPSRSFVLPLVLDHHMAAKPSQRLIYRGSVGFYHFGPAVLGLQAGSALSYWADDTTYQESFCQQP